MCVSYVPIYPYGLMPINRGDFYTVIKQPIVLVSDPLVQHGPLNHIACTLGKLAKALHPILKARRPTRSAPMYTCICTCIIHVRVASPLIILALSYAASSHQLD